jgi:hypothetical protein
LYAGTFEKTVRPLPQGEIKGPAATYHGREYDLMRRIEVVEERQRWVQ